MKLIEEYEKMAILQQEKANKEFRYSDLMPDLAFIQKHLHNAQLNLETLDAFANKMPPANLHILEAAKEERLKRQRVI